MGIWDRHAVRAARSGSAKHCVPNYVTGRGVRMTPLEGRGALLMKIRKSLAGIAAGSLALAGLAVAARRRLRRPRVDVHVERRAVRPGRLPPATAVRRQSRSRRCRTVLASTCATSAWPTTTSFARVQRGAVPARFLRPIDGGPQVQVTGPVGPRGPRFQPSTVSASRPRPRQRPFPVYGRRTASFFRASWSTARMERRRRFATLRGASLAASTPGVSVSPPCRESSRVHADHADRSHTETITVVGPEIEVTRSLEPGGRTRAHRWWR